MNKKFISTKMKITLLVLLSLSFIFYASGCIVLAQSNYRLSDYSDELHLNTNSLKYNFNFMNNFLNFTNSYSSHDYNINSNINEIYFNMNSQDIELVNTDDINLNIKIKGFSSSSYQLNLLESNNKITFSPSADIPENAEIIISVPSEISNRLILKLTTSSGDINLSNVSSNTLNVSSASGDINLSNCDLNYLYTSSSSGDINLNSVNSYIETNLYSLSGSIYGTGNFAVLTGTTTSGDIELTFEDKLNNIYLNDNSGDIYLSIPSYCGYEVNYNTLFGELNSSEGIITNGDRSNAININTTSGDLSIQLK